MSAEDESPTRVKSLRELLELQDQGGDSFLAPMGISMGPRLFGGQVAAQSLMAACRTVDPEHRPQSMHAYFILAGKTDVPLTLEVERTRDGRSFTTRRVVAKQDGAAIFEMSASFHVDEDGPADWSTPVPVEAPDPELLPAFVGMESRPSGTFFEMRPVHRSERPFAVPPYWVRANETFDDDAMNACAFTYLSDMGILAMARAPGQPIMMMASSLDHSIWFHRRYHPADWHLYTGASRSNFGARGLAVGGLFNREGVLVASVAQEGLFRTPR